jgi:hypothetical protein
MAHGSSSGLSSLAVIYPQGCASWRSSGSDVRRRQRPPPPPRVMPASWLSCRRGVARDRSRDRDLVGTIALALINFPFKAAGPALRRLRTIATVTETLTAMSPALACGAHYRRPVQPRWRDFGWTALPVVAGRLGKATPAAQACFGQARSTVARVRQSSLCHGSRCCRCTPPSDRHSSARVSLDRGA